MVKLLMNLSLVVALAGLTAAPQSAEARPHRRWLRPAPQAPLLYVEAERPIKATWTVPQPGSPDRPVWRLRGAYWTWHDRGWLVTSHPRAPWKLVRKVPKSLKVVPVYVKAPPPDLSILVTLLQPR
ncbi:MAG: hypothetical protein HY902_08900 [Deltaproteobacteria bacterium]|nr:hypothetical protein [Deltaproteobacteria bacterium]